MNERRKEKFSAITTVLKLVICMLSGLILCFPTLPVHAEEPEETIKIVVTGVGTDTDAARRNAVRNAVEQVIGVYVTADTIVRNRELLKDEILSYSGGYIKGSRIIEEKPTQDRHVVVKLEASIVSTKLKRKIESLNIAVKKMEGESLFDAASSRLEEKQTGAALLRKIISKYPQTAYNFEIDTPQIGAVDPISGKTDLSIPLKIHWDQSFLDELKFVMSQVAREAIEMADILSFSQGSKKKYLRNGLVVCFSSHAQIKSGIAEHCIIMENSTLSCRKDNGQRRNSHSEKLISLIDLPVSAEAMTLTLTFKGKDGTAVDSASYTFNRRDSDNCSKQRIVHQRGNPRSSTLRYVLEGEGFKPPNILWRNIHNRRLLIITDGVFMIEIPVRMDMHVLKEVQAIEVRMNSWTQ